MTKSLVIAVALGTVAAIAVLAAWSASSGAPTADAAAGFDFAIDMDTTGNDARLTGGADIQACGEITGAGTLDIDVIIPPPGIGATDGMKGYQFHLNYDPAVVNVTAESVMLIGEAAGSFVLPLSDTPPDTDGDFLSGATDLGPAGIEPAGASEKGPGVLARITLTGVAQGTSSLTLTNVGIVKNDTGGLAPDNIFDATVSVDVTCAAAGAPDVKITGIDCGRDPEVVKIENLGNATQDLTGWKLRSDPADLELDLSTVGAPTGSLEPGDVAFILSDSSASASPTLDQYAWDTVEKFRDGDTTDFAQVVDGADAEIDKLNCALGGVVGKDVAGYDATSDEDGVAGTCGDTLDNGGGDGADAADTDCTPYDVTANEDGVGTCGDGLDNAAVPDGVIDAADPDCHTDGDPDDDNDGSDGEDPVDGIDNDGDTAIDEDPPSYDATLTEDNVASCNDGVDNGGADGFDAADADCSPLNPSLNEDGVGTCGDGINNDSAQDGLTDAHDFKNCLGSLSTDDLDSKPGATGDDPVEATVWTPNQGTVQISEVATTQSAPSDFVFLGYEMSIVAPDATAATPLVIQFQLDSSAVPEDDDETTVQVFKGGVQVPDCTGAAGTASPDPCVSARAIVGDDVTITVLTSTASSWNLGAPPAALPAAPTPTPTPTATPAAGSSPAPSAPPPTGDAIPVDEGGSALPWLFLGLGAATIVATAGWVTYERRRRGRLSN